MTPQMQPDRSLALFQVEQQLSELLAFREAAETPEEIAATDAEIDKYFALEARKVDGVTHAIRACEHISVALSSEIQRLIDVKRSWVDRMDRIKAATLRAMQSFGLRVIENTETGSRLQVRGNGGVEPIEIDEHRKCDQYTDAVAVMPLSQWTLLIGAALDKGVLTEAEACVLERNVVETTNAIRVRQALKQGHSVPGARLLPRGEHLRIS